MTFQNRGSSERAHLLRPLHDTSSEDPRADVDSSLLAKVKREECPSGSRGKSIDANCGEGHRMSDVPRLERGDGRGHADDEECDCVAKEGERECVAEW